MGNKFKGQDYFLGSNPEFGSAVRCTGACLANCAARQQGCKDISYVSRHVHPILLDAVASREYPKLAAVIVSRHKLAASHKLDIGNDEHC
jgi:hypothetical protein